LTKRKKFFIIKNKKLFFKKQNKRG
jgi:hypothetical protein